MQSQNFQSSPNRDKRLYCHLTGWEDFFFFLHSVLFSLLLEPPVMGQTQAEAHQNGSLEKSALQLGTQQQSRRKVRNGHGTGRPRVTQSAVQQMWPEHGVQAVTDCWTQSLSTRGRTRRANLWIRASRSYIHSKAQIPGPGYSVMERMLHLSDRVHLYLSSISCVQSCRCYSVGQYIYQGWPERLVLCIKSQFCTKTFYSPFSQKREIRNR